jgi:hypothetical protein
MPVSRQLKLITGATALGLVGVSLWLAATSRGQPECAEEVCVAAVELPEAPRFGASAPDVVILLFVDLESASSRQVFQHLTRAVGGGRLDAAAQLRVLHLPEPACTDDTGRLACAAARLVECAESMAPGIGVRAAGAVFDMQWSPPGERTADHAAAAIGELGLDVGGLLRCADDVARGRAILGEHGEVAHGFGLVRAPGGLVVDASDPRRSSGFGPWVTESALRSIVRCLVHRRCGETA